MANLIKYPTAARLTVGDLTRIRAWARISREEMGGVPPGWSSDDAKLLDYLDEVLLDANDEYEHMDD